MSRQDAINGLRSVEVMIGLCSPQCLRGCYPRLPQLYLIWGLSKPTRRGAIRQPDPLSSVSEQQSAYRAVMVASSIAQLSPSIEGLSTNSIAWWTLAWNRDAEPQE